MSDMTDRNSIARARNELAVVVSAINDAPTWEAAIEARKLAWAWVNSWGEVLTRDAEILNEVVTEANVKGYTLDALKAQS